MATKRRKIKSRRKSRKYGKRKIKSGRKRKYKKRKYKIEDFYSTFKDRYYNGYDFIMLNGNSYKVNLYNNNPYPNLYDLVKSKLVLKDYEKLKDYEEIRIFRKCLQNIDIDQTAITVMVSVGDHLCKVKNSIDKPEDFDPKTSYIDVTASFLITPEFRLDHKILPNGKPLIRGEYQNIDHYLVYIYDPDNGYGWDNGDGLSRDEIENLRNRSVEMATRRRATQPRITNNRRIYEKSRRFYTRNKRK